MTSGHTESTTYEPLRPGRRHHLGGRAVGRQHDRRAVGHVGDVVDEHHAEGLEAVDDQLVVDDLVVAVHGRLEGAHHPRQRLDRHLDAGAEPAGRGQQHASTSMGSANLPAGARPPAGRAPYPGRHVRPSCRRRRARLRRRRAPAWWRATRCCRLNGQVPRDVIEWRLLADEADLELEVRRGGLDLTVEVAKREGEPLGAEVSSALFDQVRTCDNHCEFCFIYQLPPGCGPAST